MFHVQNEIFKKEVVQGSFSHLEHLFCMWWVFVYFTWPEPFYSGVFYGGLDWFDLWRVSWTNGGAGHIQWQLVSLGLHSCAERSAPLFLNSNIVKDAESRTLQSSMLWRNHIVEVYEKAPKQSNMFKFVNYIVDCSILTSLCKSLIRPLMENGDVIWNNFYDSW